MRLDKRSLADFAEELADRAGPGAQVTAFTAGASPEHVARIAALGGRLVLDHGTMRVRQLAPDGQRTGPARIEAAIGVHRVRLARNHIKAVVAIGPGGAFGHLGSANLNRINRPEQAEDLTATEARALHRLADVVFQHTRPGCADVGSFGASAWRGIDSALTAAKAIDALKVHRDSSFPASLAREDGLVLVERTGMGDAVLQAVRLVGRGATVDAVSWSLDEAMVKAFGARLRSGLIGQMRIALPARFGRRGNKAEACAMALETFGEGLRWSPAHAKVAVVRGPGGVVTISGGANFTAGGQMELVRIRHGEAAAAEAQAVLDGLELEAPPEVASQQRDFFSMLAA